MDEEEFDSLLQSKPFGTKDAMQMDARLRRCSMLGIALWGKTPDDLQCQLDAVYPEIPPGFDLSDFRELQQKAREISARLSDPRFSWLSRLAFSSHTFFLGDQRFTAWEARCEIVRRAIEYLKKL